MSVMEQKKGDQEKKWNTHNLSSRLGADATCAAVSAGLVAPLITVVDKYVE